jgi:hypothetical protein
MSMTVISVIMTVVAVIMTVVAMIMTVVETTAISAATAIHEYSAHNKHCI